MSNGDNTIPLVKPWQRRVIECVLDVDSFLSVKWPERIPIISPWLCFGSYHLIYGDAGVGKTYVMLSLVMSILTGRSVGPWTPVNQAGILYVDGEMHGQDMVDRLLALQRGLPPRSGKLNIWSSHYVALQGENSIDITRKEWQEAIEAYLQANQDIKVVVFDNLGCLAPMMDQNDQREWSTLCSWLIKLKHMNCAVMLLHHPNKQGGQRGTGARTDAADTVVHLTDNSKGSASVNCMVSFDKARGLMGERKRGFNFRLTVDGEEGSEPIIRWDVDARLTKEEEKEIAVRLAAEGVTHEKIGEQIKRSRSHVTKLLQKSDDVPKECSRGSI